MPGTTRPCSADEASRPHVVNIPTGVGSPPPGARPVAQAAGDDGRLKLFAEYLDAIDRRDVRAMKEAVRRLRSAGFSVVYMGPAPKGSGRP